MHRIPNRFEFDSRRKRKTNFLTVLVVLGGMFIWFFYAILYAAFFGALIYVVYHLIHKHW